MDAYFSVFVAQKETLNATAAGRNKTDPKNSPELANIKNVFTSAQFNPEGLIPFAKVLILPIIH